MSFGKIFEFFIIPSVKVSSFSGVVETLINSSGQNDISRNQLSSTMTETTHAHGMCYFNNHKSLLLCPTKSMHGRYNEYKLRLAHNNYVAQYTSIMNIIVYSIMS